MRIALSGLSGVGSTTTAKMVAERLNLPMSNFTFRNLEAEYGVPWQEILHRAKTEPEIDLRVDRYQIEFAQKHGDCLLCTDFACWLDEPIVAEKVGLKEGIEFDLKIWLEASLETRAKRMMEREQGRTLEQLMVEEHDRDIQTQSRLQKLYGLDWFDLSKIDWEFNTEELSLEQVVDAIVEKVELIEKQK